MRDGLKRPPAARQAGFTLLELMIVVAIIAILLKVVVPSFATAILSNSLASHANSFTASVQLARGEAIKRNVSVVMCRSASPQTACASSGGFEQGWIVFADNDGDGAVDTGETIVLTQSALTGYSAISTATALTFLPSGLRNATGDTTFKLCKSGGAQERVITISITGRPRIDKTETGNCS